MSKLKFASLTAGLLARKGEAEPSATPFAEQLLTRVGAPAVDLRPMIQNTPLRPNPVSLSTAVFGRRLPHEVEQPHHEPAEAPPAPIPLHSPSLLSAVEQQHQDIVHEVFQYAPHEVAHELQHESRCVACPGPSAEDAHKTYHVNLRMKRMRFIRLKLTAALLRKPVQVIVSEALDAWFETVPTDVLGDCACLHSRGD